MPNRIRVTRPTLFRLAAESCRDPKTVEVVLEGGGNGQSREAVRWAAQRLNLPEVVAFLSAPAAAPPALAGMPSRLRAT